VIKKVKKNKRFKRLNGTLKNSTESALDKYFKTLNGTKPDNLYNLVIKEVEAPLLKKIMEYTENNQTQASKILGINRTTLRTKLKEYKLIK
jgi:Fis family transcriptional regulator